MTLCDTFDAGSLRPCDRSCAIFLAQRAKEAPRSEGPEAGLGYALQGGRY